MAGHAIWSGTISFGLVSIPVKLFTAVRESEGIHFNLLHAKDEGRIHNLRKCSECGKEVAWTDLVKGYEFEKGQYVTVTDEELKSYRPEATQSIDIVEFVDMPEIDPMLYDKPYYIEPEKKGRHAYALLREALKKSGKVGIAKVVLRTREYLAAVKPAGNALVLEMMHFANEIVKPDAFDFPPAKEKTPEGEMKAALMLIDAMAKEFDPTEFHDKYREELKAMLDAKAEGAPPPKVKSKGAASTNVVDLMAVLQKSLSATKAGPSVHAARADGEGGHGGKATKGSKAGGANGARKSASKAARGRSETSSSARRKAS
jgi:DNA end-binding protein Ku